MCFFVVEIRSQEDHCKQAVKFHFDTPIFFFSDLSECILVLPLIRWRRVILIFFFGSGRFPLWQHPLHLDGTDGRDDGQEDDGLRRLQRHFGAEVGKVLFLRPLCFPGPEINSSYAFPYTGYHNMENSHFGREKDVLSHRKSRSDFSFCGE